MKFDTSLTLSYGFYNDNFVFNYHCTAVVTFSGF